MWIRMRGAGYRCHYLSHCVGGEDVNAKVAGVLLRDMTDKLELVLLFG